MRNRTKQEQDDEKKKNKDKIRLDCTLLSRYQSDWAPAGAAPALGNTIDCSKQSPLNTGLGRGTDALVSQLAAGVAL